MYALIARTILLYLLIVAGLRIMGKRQIGELLEENKVCTADEYRHPAHSGCGCAPFGRYCADSHHYLL